MGFPSSAGGSVRISAPRNNKRPREEMLSATAEKRVSSDLEEMQKHPIEGVACLPKDGDLSTWQIFMEGPKDSYFDGGVFELEMKFPQDYPDSPPTLYFKSEFWHPNIYPDGKVCMSSLHPPGDNEMDNESFDIRWKPINSVSSILNSVLLILQEPNFSSPANIDASVQWQRQFDDYKVRIAELCELSKQVFERDNGTVFIPHPDSNPAERSMYKDDEPEADDDWDLENMEESEGDLSGSEDVTSDSDISD